MRFKRKLSACALLAAAAIPAADAMATLYTWTGGGIDSGWGNSGNWAPGGVPAAADTASFTNPGTLRAGPNLGNFVTTTTGTVIVSGSSVFGDYLFSAGTNGVILKANNGFFVNNSIAATNMSFGTMVLQGGGLNILGSCTVNLLAHAQVTAPVNLSGTGALNIFSDGEVHAQFNHGGTGTVNVNFNAGLLAEGFTQNGGGVTNINAGGRLSLFQGGVLSNGTINVNALGSINFLNSTQLEVKNSGVLHYTTSTDLPNGTKFLIDNGGDLIADGFLNLSGTMTVDGGGLAGTTVQATGQSGWGGSTVVIQQAGVGTYDSLSISSSSISILTGGKLTVTNALSIGNAGGSSSQDKFNITGGTLTGNGTTIINAARMTIGSGGALNLNGDGSITTDGSVAWTGGSLAIAPTKTLTITGGTIDSTVGGTLSNGATLRVNADGLFKTSSFFDVANLAGAGTGALIVDGANARFTSASSFSDWGNNNGNIATVTFSNGGAGTYSGGIQMTRLGGKATLNLLSSGNLTTGTFSAGGTAATTAATINIAGGSFNILGAGTFLNASTVNLSAGALVIGGSTSFVGGSVLKYSGGVISVGAGATLALNGGVATLTTGGALRGTGGTLRIGAGGLFSTTSYFDIGNSVGGGSLGSMVVTGPNARFISTSASALGFTDWGANPGDFATISFSAEGAGTYGGGLHIAAAGGQALVTLNSGGQLNVSNEFLVGGFASSSATINIAGGTLISNGAAFFQNGAVVNLTSGGFTPGNGTFSSGSSFTWSGGNLNLASTKTLTFNNASGSFTSGGSLSAGATLQIINNGSVIVGNGLTGVYDIANTTGSGTLIVNGGTFNQNGFFSSNLWANTSTDSAAVTFTNSGVGTFGSPVNIATGGGSATVNVLNSAKLITNGLNVGSLGTFFGTVPITVTGGTLTNTGSMNLRGGANLSYNSGSISTGALSLADNSILSINSASNPPLRASGLTMSGTSRLFLQDGKMIVASTPLATIKGYVSQGYNGGNWLGAPGILSTPAQGDFASSAAHKRAVGYASAGSIGLSTFFGQPVNPTDTLLRLTWYGDANLDGKVNALDLNILATNFGGGSGKFWFNGDFSYDGTVNTQDFTMLSMNFGQAIPAPPLGTLVPEPCVLLLLCAPTLLRRQRMVRI